MRSTLASLGGKCLSALLNPLALDSVPEKGVARYASPLCSAGLLSKNYKKHPIKCFESQEKRPNKRRFAGNPQKNVKYQRKMD